MNDRVYRNELAANVSEFSVEQQTVSQIVCQAICHDEGQAMCQAICQAIYHDEGQDEGETICHTAV